MARLQLSEAKARGLANHPDVAWVEQDSVVTTNATQTGATWGLDRIDQRNLPLDSDYIYNYDGSGVHAYIIDTGIRASHNEFSGRIGGGYDFVDNDSDPDDCNGHGTHVAGTVGGSTYGVSKGVTLHSIRVLNCYASGSYSGVIAGIDWVTMYHISPAVANMSLSGGASISLDNAVNDSVTAGVVHVVSAGNDNTDACNYSPARVSRAITVAATTLTDDRSSFSNWGGMCRYLRARLQYNVNLEYIRHRDQYHQWNIHGLSTRCWGRGFVTSYRGYTSRYTCSN